MPRLGKSIGIVGSEAAKFTPATEQAARELISRLLAGGAAVVSGGCHLGGIDSWAAEAGRELGLAVVEFLPQRRSWSGGYRERNERIAEKSSEVHCITVAELPAGYDGMTFEWCYHCKSKRHVKSGGCWTAKFARRIGRAGGIWVIQPDGGVVLESTWERRRA